MLFKIPQMSVERKFISLKLTKLRVLFKILTAYAIKALMNVANPKFSKKMTKIDLSTLQNMSPPKIKDRLKEDHQRPKRDNTIQHSKVQTTCSLLEARICLKGVHLLGTLQCQLNKLAITLNILKVTYHRI
jgi:uncharacterized UBP type Zn finger protein